MDLIKGVGMSRSFRSELERAYSEAGSCLGSTICKLVVAEAVDNYMGISQGFRTGVSPKIFTVEPLEITLVGIAEIEKEKAVVFNNDINLVFSPGALMQPGQTINAIKVADDVIANNSKKYFINVTEGLQVAQALNEAVFQRMMAVSADCKKIAEAIQKSMQANKSYSQAY